MNYLVIGTEKNEVIKTIGNTVFNLSWMRMRTIYIRHTVAEVQIILKFHSLKDTDVPRRHNELYC